MSDKFYEKVNENELSDIVELVGKNGQVYNFFHVGTIEYKDEWYAFFMPEEPREGVDPDEMVIFRISEDESGEVLLLVKDETLLGEVYAEFMREIEDDESCDGNCAGCHGCNGND